MSERDTSPPAKSSREWLLVIFMAISGAAVMLIWNAATERMRVIETRIDAASARQSQLETAIVEIRSDMRNEFKNTRDKLDELTAALRANTTMQGAANAANAKRFR